MLGSSNPTEPPCEPSSHPRWDYPAEETPTGRGALRPCPLPLGLGDGETVKASPYSSNDYPPETCQGCPPQALLSSKSWCQIRYMKVVPVPGSVEIRLHPAYPPGIVLGEKRKFPFRDQRKHYAVLASLPQGPGCWAQCLSPEPSSQVKVCAWHSRSLQSSWREDIHWTICS